MLIPIIGLEVHVQLKTKSKLFCSCVAHEAATPNTNVCPVCLAHPGTLPVPNQEAVRMAVTLGLALGCRINSPSRFDRKHYFYPDLPKGYQISQYEHPVAEGGLVILEVPGGERPNINVGITRAHLEEDAGKSFHLDDGTTLVDFNRAGIPLVETVTEADLRSPAEAKAFLQELRLIVRTLGISDGDMEKGHLRCDANISLREYDDAGEIVGLTWNPKTEIKNLNSFRHVERALLFEINRQTECWKAGATPSVTTTRRWNDAKQQTEEMRTKEGAADYRYFPEPDIPPLVLAPLAEELKTMIPELPAAKRRRFVDEYQLKPADAKLLIEDPGLADFAEHAFSELAEWQGSLPEFAALDETEKKKGLGKLTKLCVGYLTSKLTGLLAERGSDIRIAHLTPENFAELITLVATNKLNSRTAVEVLGHMLETGADPSHIMEDRQLGQIQNTDMLAAAINRVIAGNPKEAAAYKAGKTALLQFFVGKVMKETEGTADPKMTQNLLVVTLEK
ncbi:Asp-tRNA(Asn)/Glu-tRNA(Gln) amidotransferase subunit GatB [Candidatus Uhrbacteria bacterium]|nr:Asp-tRNA(Asn)/Glu-tRNA(Gln) amidotransferase subunit GatB [Candidatus Uhrbacteria bacterium]